MKTESEIKACLTGIELVTNENDNNAEVVRLLLRWVLE
jgi:hypothetical protein